MNARNAMKLTLALTVGLLAAASTPDSHAAVDKKIERLWKAKCASCHGADGKGQTEQGKKNHAEDMTSKEWQKARTDADMKKAILEGFKRNKNGVDQKMEALKDGTSEQGDALVAMIRAMSP